MISAACPLHPSLLQVARTAFLRIRITRPLFGRIDGIRLSQFQEGRTYEVSATLGCYLVVIGGARIDSGDEPAEVPLQNQGIDELQTPKKTSPLAEAADRPPRRRKRR